MRKFALMLLWVLVGLLPALAQEARVTGRITDASGTGLEGVTVTVKGTQTTTVTNTTGEFSIRAANGQRLVFSSVGYLAKEADVTGGRVELSLDRSTGDLGEVVVVGYGTQRRGAITGAVSTVKGDQLIKRPTSNTTMALQGFTPGLVIQQGSGQPGADGGSINIRGIGSITGGSGPLIVVDGVEFANMNDVDPNVIESITVLKDAASTAVYGVRGTNGVILIKTRRGQNGRTNISFNSFVSKQTPTNFPEVLSAVDNMILNNEAQTNAGLAPIYNQATIDLYRNTAANNLTVFDTDWKDLIFQNNGLMQNHNIIVSGGTDKVNFLASGTLLNQQGLIVNNRFKRYDLRLNSDVRLNNRVKFSADLFYTNATNLQPAALAPVEIIQRGISMARNFPAKFGEGQYGDAGQSNRINPVAAAEASGFNKANTPTLSMRFALNIEVFKNFVLEGAYNNRSSYTEAYEARAAYASYNPNPLTNTYTFDRMIGDSTLSYSNNRNITNQYYGSGTYSYNLNNVHSFKLQAGFQGIDNTATSIGVSRAGLPDPNRPYLNLATSSIAQLPSGSATDNSLAGFFGRFNYSFRDKYFLEVTGRYDGASRFSQFYDQQWGFFPGVSAGWVVTKESFMDKVSFINYAKLRASYGELGNQESVPGNYPFVASLNGGTAYYFNSLLNAGSSLNNIPNETISWETSKQSNIGVDLSLLRNKLSVTFDVYRKKINDLIFNRPVSNALGFAGSSFIPSNAGSMVNNGWEFSATYRTSLRKANFSVTANVSDVRNKVLETQNQDIVQGIQVTRAGFPVRSYFLYRTDGLYQTGDNFQKPYNVNRTSTTGAGDVRYVDVDGNDTINARDRVLVGNNFPRYDYSFNFNADLKGFDLNVFLFGVGKRDNYISGVGVEPFNAGNWIASGLTTALDRWTPGKTNGRYPRLYSGGNGNYASSDFWLRNGAFMRVKHITLGYTLGKNLSSRVGIQSLRFYVNVVNPFTFSDYEPGFDPEPSNVNGSFYPIMKTYTAGINLRF